MVCDVSARPFASVTECLVSRHHHLKLIWWCCCCFVVDCSSGSSYRGGVLKCGMGKPHALVFKLSIALKWAVLLWLVWIKSLSTWATVCCLGLSLWQLRCCKCQTLKSRSCCACLCLPVVVGEVEMVEQVTWMIIQWGAWLVLQCPEEASFFS